MLQRTPVAIRADVATRHPTMLIYGRVRTSLDDAPPLDPSGIAVLNQDRRRVSLRWLVGSVLTALSGAALIGGAIVISLQGEIVQVERPQRAIAQNNTANTQGATVRKADRLVRREIAGNAIRQEFKAPMTVRNKNREVIKARDFVRVSAPLSLTTGTYARAIPPFNALNIFAEPKNSALSAQDTSTDSAEADVFVVKHDLTPLAFSPDAPALNAEEAQAQVTAEERTNRNRDRNAPMTESARNMLFRSLRHTGASTAPMAYAGLNELPFRDIDVRVIPENVTLLPKQSPPLTLANDNAAEKAPVLEEYVAGRPGDLVFKLLVDEGALPDNVRAIMAALDLQEQYKLKEGQSLAILPALDFPKAKDTNQPDDAIGRGALVIGRVILRDGETFKAIAALTDDGQYVPAFLPQDEMISANTYSSSNELDRNGASGAPLYDSLFETAARFNVPVEVVRALIPLFAADIDLQRRVASGESLELLYTNVEEDGKPELLYASLTVEGETKSLYRFQAPKDNEISFFDPEGRSLRKFLIRKPIAEGRLTSGFGMRYHPVLHYAKMHTGIDWAHKVGTPILAAGDGVLAKVGWHSGYGKRVEIQHRNGYLTSYSHMSNFARGLKAGDRIKQGQVIGYLGSTGLSTGPHLHYEVMVNGRFVDPMKIKLPRGNELDGADLAEFMLQRDQVKELLQKAQASG